MNTDSSSNHAFDHIPSAVGTLQRWGQCLHFLLRKSEVLHYFETLFSLGPKWWFERSALCFVDQEGLEVKAAGLWFSQHCFGLPLFYICFSTDDCLCKRVPQQQQQQQQIGLEISCIWQSLISAHAMKPNFIFPSVHFLSNTIHASSSLC